MEKVRFGVVGVGNQGKKYLEIFKNNQDKLDGCIVAACDIDKSKLDFVKKNYKGIALFDNYKDMFSSGLIDVVLIETPHYIHPQIAIDAFNSNINVLTDKPAGVDISAVKKLNDESLKHKDLLFGIIYNQRTNPLYLKAKEIINSKDFGKFTRLVWIITDWYRPQAYYDQGGWRGTWNGEGGGVLLNQCPHQLDLLTWLVGLPVKLTAKAETIGRNITVENDVTSYFTFENGATGVFISSTHDTPGTNRLEITGEGGKIVIENDTLTFIKNDKYESDFSKVNKGPWDQPKTKKYEYSLEKGNLEVKYLDQHLGIFKNYIDYLTKKDKVLLAPGIEGINGLTLSNAIYLSSWTNKEVSIPLDEKLFLELIDKKRIEESKLNTK